MTIVPKWTRFEQTWKSSLVYSNPVQDVTLTISFTSPLGETYQTYGFWDGNKIWRVRFSPNLPGRWQYKATCSDTSNRGLHNQSGQFLCTAANNKTRFTQHGPVEIALGHNYFRHSDGTPFFWLGEDVSNGARLSRPQDWDRYAKTRASQKFTVAQWIAAPGLDPKQPSAFAGEKRVIIRPEYFQRLDNKLAVLTQAGLLSAIVPLDLTSGGDGLADDQFALLLRYMVARWGADPVAWIIPIDPVKQPHALARWRKIGHALLGEASRPVIAIAAEPTMLDSLRDQTWVDAFSYQPITQFNDFALKKGFESLSLVAKNEPIRPSIAMLPPENASAKDSEKSITADDVRRACYWSFLLDAPAGISYATPGITDWTTTAASREKGKAHPLQNWEKSLLLPSVRQLTGFARFLESIDFWRLRPEPAIIANQPGLEAPAHFIASAVTDTRDLSLVYVPEERTLEITLRGMPASPSVAWLDPRTGESSPAVAVVGENSCQFPTPDSGDWLLVLRAGK